MTYVSHQAVSYVFLFDFSCMHYCSVLEYKPLML